MSRAIAGLVLLAATILGIQMLLLLNERWGGPSSQELIDLLVTTNPQTRGDDWMERLPVGWNPDEEARVWRVWHRLNEDPRRHMTTLITNVERREFSTAISTAVPYSPLYVGDLCRWIIEGHFYQHAYQVGLAEPAPRTSSPNYFARPQVELTQWWENHQHHSDQEIGILIKEWHRRHSPASHPSVR